MVDIKQRSGSFEVMKVLLLLLCSVISMKAIAQEIISDTSSIIRQLSAIRERDQNIRRYDDSVKFITQVDSANLVQIEAFISKYGWPGKSFVGIEGNYTIWLVIQHSDLATQEKYLPLLEQSVKEGESRPQDLAYLTDRILMRKGKPQIYGTQLWSNQGVWEFWKIEDEKNVNERRKRAGLGSIEEYANLVGIEYKPHTEN